MEGSAVYVGENQTKSSFITASVDGSSLFFPEIYYTPHGTDTACDAVCDGLWTAFEKNAGEAAPPSTDWGCHIAVGGRQFVDWVNLGVVLLGDRKPSGVDRGAAGIG